MNTVLSQAKKKSLPTLFYWKNMGKKDKRDIVDIVRAFGYDLYLGTSLFGYILKLKRILM